MRESITPIIGAKLSSANQFCSTNIAILGIDGRPQVTLVAAIRICGLLSTVSGPSVAPIEIVFTVLWIRIVEYLRRVGKRTITASANACWTTQLLDVVIICAPTFKIFVKVRIWVVKVFPINILTLVFRVVLIVTVFINSFLLLRVEVRQDHQGLIVFSLRSHAAEHSMETIL